MKILVLGHKGMLGGEIMSRLGRHHEMEGRDIDEFDISLRDDCRDIIESTDPDVVVNAAAVTDVDGCEDREDDCFAVNAEGVRHVAALCRERGIKIVHFSTDYVFDGTADRPYDEDHICNPINSYGRSKLQGEIYLKSEAGDFLLVRTSWLFGKGGNNFVKAIAEKAKGGGELTVVADQFGSPTYAFDLAGAVQELIEGDFRGTFHVTNRGSCSWYEFALKILEYREQADARIIPIESKDLTRKAMRPGYSILSCRKFIEATGKTMRFWQIALRDYVNRMEY